MDDGKAYINLEAALARLRGNEAVFKSLLRKYAERDDFERLSSDLAKSDVDAAAKTVHTIKGAAGNLSLDEVYKLAVQAEALFKGRLPYEESVGELLEAQRETLNRIDSYAGRKG